MLNLDEFKIDRGSRGSLKLMRQTAAYSECKGIWRDLGMSKEFLAKDEGLKAIWWPDTDDMALQYDAKKVLKHHGCEDHHAESKSKKRKWTKIDGGLDDGYSLPVMCIHDLARFMARSASSEDLDLSPEIWADHETVMARAAAIRLPRPDADKHVVVHQFGPKNEYRGFVVRRRNAPVERFRGVEVIDDCINLSVPSDLGVSEPVQMSQVVTSMIREYDKHKPRVWDFDGCERFFEDNLNFVK